jgi:ABC-2 type transport system ATP-binding protein
VADAPAIETAGLSKRYANGVEALAALDLRVERGEVMGYLGPNGAGKSTTIRMLVDLIRPSAGRASILGLDTRAQSVQARARLGYLPGDLRVPDRLTARAQLDSLARLRGQVDAAYRDALCERFGVVMDRPMRELSRGNRQKIGIVQAFMHRPEVLILDEPTSGLDPLLQGEFRALLRETAADGRTVFLSSHVLDEVQHAADRVAILNRGRLVDVDAVGNLQRRALRHVTIAFRAPVDPVAFASLDAVRVEGVDGPIVRLAAPADAMDAIVKAAAAHDVVDLTSQPADLEEIFLELYREPPDAG